MKPVILLFSAILALSVISCSKAEKKEIRIGIAGAYSGDLASYGIPSRKAAELVIDEVNKAGGIKGKKIVLVAEDDACKPEVAANIAAKLVGENVLVVLGHICSGATKSAISIYRDAKIICLSPSATSPELTESGSYPNFFRTIAPDNAQAKLDAEFTLKTLKLKKIAVIHDKGDYGKGFAEFVKKYIEESKTASVALFEGITPGAVDYTAIINKIAASGAEALIYGGYHPEASKIVSQMKKRGMKLPFISDDGVKDETFIKVAGEYAEGVYASGPKDTTENPLAIKAIELHKKKFGEAPGAFYLNAYAGMLAIVNAIEKSSSLSSESIAESLRKNFVNTPLGSISFDKKGDAIGVGFSIYQVKNGKYVEVK